MSGVALWKLSGLVLRILCLHGYHGSADVLRAQMRSLTAGLESFVELVCVDSPSLAAGDHGWWHALREVGPDRVRYEGWERTRAALVSAFAEQGPFDGIFGFSQGAALAGLLLGLRAPDGKPTPEKPLSFDFAVMVGGFVSNDPRHAALYASSPSYDLPSVHILGRSDWVVPPGESRALAARFNHPLILEHEGGHVIASDTRTRAEVRAFLQARLQERAARQGDAPGQVSEGPGAQQGTCAAPSPRLEVPLWPGRAHPSMRVFFPDRPQSGPAPAILVFRGGGYSTSAGSGAGSAEWIASQGLRGAQGMQSMVGIEVEYRTQATGDSYPAAYDDAARAVRLVRQRAPEWGIDPNRIAVLGYSAGGHLASLLGTQPSLHIAPDDDLAPRVSARPDLVILAYPLISFVDGYRPGAFLGSAESFFGRRDLGGPLRRQFSNELHVDARHPPVFVWTTEDDSIVPYTQAKGFADACRRAGVPVTFTLFPHGQHGLGLALGEPSDVRTWTSLLLAWLATHWAGRAPGAP